MDAGQTHHHRELCSDDRATTRRAAGNQARPRWWGTTSMNLAARQPVAHAIMFYLLSTAALLIFAPCVIVPIWRDVQRLADDEYAMRAVVMQLHEQIEKNEVRIDALMNDPQVVERVARRELNRNSQNEQHVLWSPAELASLRLHIPHDVYEKPELPPPSAPPWVETATRWLPAWPWPELFAKRPNREFLLIMSGCLLLTAFVLYTPRAQCRLPDDD